MRFPSRQVLSSAVGHRLDVVAVGVAPAWVGWPACYAARPGGRAGWPGRAGRPHQQAQGDGTGGAGLPARLTTDWRGTPTVSATSLSRGRSV
jgi:hypothetical protein